MQLPFTEVFSALRLLSRLGKFLFELADPALQGMVLYHKGMHPFFNLGKSVLKVLQMAVTSI